MSLRNFHAPNRQRGVTLVIVLLLLIVVTLLGLAAMRGSILQERMAGNVAARGIAFQAAESALRVGEEYLRVADPPVPANGCTGGVCAMPVDGAAPAHEAANFWSTAANYRSIAVDDDSNISMLRYAIESLGEGTASAASSGPSECLGAEGDQSGCVGADGAANVRNFRITAIAQTDNGAQVVLQSTFQMP